ncbi:ATP-dependent RNA helicase RhlE [Stella humosa]|uniref:DEAD-box ATP-dependent RNA helicase RhpA n=1 Tax=Stella humosa TaxID=94 RepID=A0A3N1KXM1_9PROT|nr:DEAD/DEAH box helicase [Stella humosa]ROP83330.1 ATP-dependent RNA helicase RhlE [Stella humosa]
MTQFSDLGLAAPIMKALAEEGYVTPTPIQAQAIPYVLAGRDLLGIAQTGTGKTAAFALPILQRLAADRRQPVRKSCRALILSPTRELAIQIAESFKTYGRHLGLRVTLAFGGVPLGAQIRALSGGVDVVVATPGRLIDHLDTGAIRLDQVEMIVLDEADHMLDMGFIHAVKRIVRSLPHQRQTLFFSATMPREIGQLAGDMLRDPARVEVAPVATTAERVEQRMIFAEQGQKPALLVGLIKEVQPRLMLVFTRTKHGADRVVRHLEQAGIDSAAIHGNKSQSQREKALAAFRAGKTRILVATDIAARGIDVDGVSHVINFDLPNVPESYVHRIGRTARAGADGIAIGFCSGEEKAYLKDIEKLIGQKVTPMGSPVELPAARPSSPSTAQRPAGHTHSNRRFGGAGAGAGNSGRPQQGRPARRPQQGQRTAAAR